MNYYGQPELSPPLFYPPFCKHTLVYLCSEILQGYSDSISGQTPPSCGRSSEPHRAAWSSTETAWEPEPGSGLWTRVSSERRAEPWCWSHLCVTRNNPTHTHMSTYTRLNRTKKCLAHWVGSKYSYRMICDESDKNRLMDDLLKLKMHHKLIYAV